MKASEKYERTAVTCVILGVLCIVATAFSIHWVAGVVALGVLMFAVASSSYECAKDARRAEKMGRVTTTTEPTE